MTGALDIGDTFFISYLKKINMMFIKKFFLFIL